jgi:alpha-tubulin suppressor-like RCC1 family protein
VLQLASTWSAIATTVTHSCAIRSDGLLWCWGNNARGAIGNGPVDSTTQARQVVISGATSDNGWTQISVGGEVPSGINRSVSCGIKSGELWCWGDNTMGQLGITSFTAGFSSAPQKVLSGTSFKAVSVSSAQVCAVSTSDALFCWGFRSAALGASCTPNPAFTAASVCNTPVAVSGTWNSVSVGTQHACGIRTTGEVACWGVNLQGEVGAGGTSSSTPVDVMTGSWLSVSAGEATTCAIKSGDRTLWCWGRVYSTANPSITPTQVLPSGWRSVSTSHMNTCAVNFDNQLMCWGYNSGGSLGQGFSSIAYESTAVQEVNAASDWATISTSRFNTNASACGLTTAGTIRCFGANDYGPLMFKNNTTRTPIAIPMPE